LEDEWEEGCLIFLVLSLQMGDTWQCGLLPGIEHMKRETECFQSGIEHLFIWEENKI